MNPADRKRRQEEVQEAAEAAARLDDPALRRWRDGQKDEIMLLLLNAPVGYQGDSDRLHAQARLQALNALASDLKRTIETGKMAEQQIADDKRKKERKNLRTVA